MSDLPVKKYPLEAFFSLDEQLEAMEAKLAAPSQDPVALGMWHMGRYIAIGLKELQKEQPKHVQDSWANADKLYTTPPDAAAQIAELTKQRDELLAALEWVYGNTHAHPQNVRYVVGDAISRVKGETK